MLRKIVCQYGSKRIQTTYPVGLAQHFYSIKMFADKFHVVQIYEKRNQGNDSTLELVDLILDIQPRPSFKTVIEVLG